MITCEFCGTQAEQHDHWRHEIMARVAALEDVVTREPPAEQPIRQETDGGEAICGHGNDEDCPDCFRALQRDRAQAEAAEQSALLDAAWAARHPLAETPAPAVGTLRDAGLTADTMPKEVLAMLYERATDTLIEARQLRKDQVAALEARLAQAERERDEWRPRYEAAAADARTLREAWARAERERDELGRQVEQMAAHVAGTRYNGAVKEREEATATIERVAYNTPEAVARSESDVTVLIELRRAQKERDEATARERERCLAWVRHFNPMSTAVDHAIKGGREVFCEGNTKGRK